MSGTASGSESGAVRPSAINRTAVTLFAVVLLTIVGLFLVWRFAEAERARDLEAWRIRLGIVADSRANAVADWVATQRAVIAGVAENPSTQAHLTALADPGTAFPDIAAAQGALRDLLIVAAESAGFVTPGSASSLLSQAGGTGGAGLAIVSRDGRPVVRTPGMPPMDELLRDFVRRADADRAIMLDMYPGVDRQPTMAFAVPVFGSTGGRELENRIGIILGVKVVDRDLFSLLRQPGVATRSGEVMLVRGDGGFIDYLSPLADGTRALGKRLALDGPDRATAFAQQTAGGFAILPDYRGAEVLVTSRAIPGTPWTLVHKIDRTEALAASDRRLIRLVGIFLLAIAVVVAVLIAVWRHGSSRRATTVAQGFQMLAARYEGQQRLLRLVTDSQPNAIYIADGEGRYRFANREAAERAGVDGEDMMGKTMAAVLGPAAAERSLDRIRHVMADGRPKRVVDRFDEEGTRIVQTQFIPLNPTPVTEQGVLVVEEDITAAIVERERREDTLRQLVETLVAIADRRDPYAAGHSRRVAGIATAIADEMKLEPVLVETVGIAGSLMNLGKIMVPSSVLTKAGSLSDDERRMVRDSMLAAADLLSGIDFDGPVVETLRQAHERMDGSGLPDGRKGEDILVTARVLAVANAFVAMVSPRAHRPGADVDEVLAALMADAGTAFDRGVVAALVNHIDNRGGREEWSSPAETATA